MSGKIEAKIANDIKINTVLLLWLFADSYFIIHNENCYVS